MATSREEEVVMEIGEVARGGADVEREALQETNYLTFTSSRVLPNSQSNRFVSSRISAPLPRPTIPIPSPITHHYPSSQEICSPEFNCFVNATVDVKP
uniref:Uncharacterized protein n=1 Tax=Kalanchoe fedtschenkoi TaxID=63787 RepID=A0A7N0V9U6_KALFE